MSKKIVFSIALLLSVPIFAVEVLTFIEKDFSAFVNRTVPATQRERFANYYERITAQINSKQEVERQELSYTLRKTALDTLKTEHRSWAQDITAFLSDPHYLDAAFDAERGQLREFLSWYGAYEKFQEATQAKAKTRVALTDSSNFFDTVKVQIAKATNKIGGWFKTLKTRLT